MKLLLDGSFTEASVVPVTTSSVCAVLSAPGVTGVVVSSPGYYILVHVVHINIHIHEKVGTVIRENFVVKKFSFCAK